MKYSSRRVSAKQVSMHPKMTNSTEEGSNDIINGVSCSSAWKELSETITTFLVPTR